MDPIDNAINYYQRNISHYTNNMSEYNSIMRSYINNRLNPHSRHYIRTPPVNINTNIRNNNPYSQIPIYNYERRRVERHSPDYEDVVVRPTNEQIENALETFLCGNTEETQTCPITLEPIIQGDQVSRIRHCGHTFKKNAIYSWFMRNVRCPVCRYDIRTSEPQHEEEESNEEIEYTRVHEAEAEAEIEREMEEQYIHSERQESNNEFSELLRENAHIPTFRSLHQSNIAGVFTNAIRSFVNEELQRLPVNSTTRDLIYTFDLPLAVDASGNYRL